MADTNESAGSIVTKGVAISGIGNILLRFLDVGIAILLLRWLSIFEFGIYKLVLAAYEFFAGFFLAGLEDVVVSDVSRSLKSDARHGQVIFSFYFYFMIFMGLIMASLFFFLPRLLIPWIGEEGRRMSYLVSLLFLLAPLETAYKLRFEIFLDFRWGALFKVLNDVVRLALIGVLFYLFSFNVAGALWAVASGVGVPVLAALFFYKRSRLIIIPSWEEIKRAIRHLFLQHGKWAVADNFLMNTGKNIRPFIIKTFAGVEAVALFSVAQNLIANLTSVFPIRDILTPALPRFAEEPVSLGSKIIRATKYATLAYIILGLAGALGVPLFVFIFFPKYWISLPLFYILLINLPWLGFRSVALPVFYALKQQRLLFFLTALRLILITILGIILTYMFGVWGAAIEAMLVGILVTPPMARALRVILPQWKFSFKSLITFDEYDREIWAKIKARLKEKVSSIWVRKS